MNKICSIVSSGRSAFALITFGAFAGLACGAIPIGNSNVQIGGFFSQGYIESDGNNYPFEDSDGSFDFREMGVNASTTVGAHLRVGGQLFAQRLGDYGQDKVKLDWAVADYNFRQEFGIRLGRVKYPKGLYGEALDLDAVRPFVFLPMSIYNPVLRDFNSSFNGAMFYGTVDAAKVGSFDYKAFYGKMPLNTDQGVADFFNTTSLYTPEGVSSISLDHVTGGQLAWNTPVNGLKVVLSYSALADLDATGKFFAFPAGNVSLHAHTYSYRTFSVEYIHDQWTLAGEFQRNEGTFNVIQPFGTTGSNSHVNNWYVSVARRLNDKFEVGAYYDVQENGTPTAGTPDVENHNRDLALSFRYDLNEHVTIKIEGHTIDGVYNMFNTPRTPNPSLDNHTNYFAVKTTFSF
jgi:hypothetical protein